MSEYRRIDLNAWTKVGEGGNGSTYESPDRPEVILKVNKPKLSNLETVKHEYEVSKAVESVGIRIPRMLEMVLVGDGYGTISERVVNKKSLSRICHDQPERTEEMARLLSREGKKFFGTPCPEGIFPSRKEQLLDILEKVTYVPRRYKKVIREFARAIPESQNCVHGDFQTGNLIVSGDECYWIDLDRFAHGDPMFDIGHLFLICKYYSSMKRVQDIFHMSKDQFLLFWDAFAADFTGSQDHSGFDARAGRFALIDIIVRSRFEAPGFAERLFFGLYVKKLFKLYFR